MRLYYGEGSDEVNERWIIDDNEISAEGYGDCLKWRRGEIQQGTR